jgi:quinolinate synthase
MPDRRFEPLSEEAVCAFMKLITLEKVRDSLRDMVYPITVEPSVAERARAAVERMVAIG